MAIKRSGEKKAPTKEPEEMGHIEERDVIKHAARALIRSACNLAAALDPLGCVLFRDRDRLCTVGEIKI